VPHSRFVEEHLNEKLDNVVCTGRRVNLSQKITNQLTEQIIKSGMLDNQYLKIIDDGLFGKSFDVKKGFYLKNKFLRKTLN